MLSPEGIKTLVTAPKRTECDTKICISDFRFGSTYFKRDLILYQFLVWKMHASQSLVGNICENWGDNPAENGRSKGRGPKTVHSEYFFHFHVSFLFKKSILLLVS